MAQPTQPYNPISDEEIDKLIGIDEDGNISSTIVSLALAKALNDNIELFYLMTAIDETETNGTS